MNYVIIGGSAAGVSAAETLRKHDKHSKITLISDESFPLYSRCLLTYLIAGSLDENNLYFKERDFYQKNRIKTYLGRRAVLIKAKERKLALEDQSEITYDKLLLATGASPKLVDAPGINKRGIFTLRKLAEARAILKMLGDVKESCVLGGGLIGLRDAYALRLRKKQVTVIVKSPQVLSQMVDAPAARIIAEVLEKNGVKIKTGVAAQEVLGEDTAEEILLDTGERVKCQMVIIGKGVSANIELAKSGGLEAEDGILVNNYLRTSQEHIFAAGDCAQTYDIARGTQRINALWPCAVEQGETAALNMLGRQIAYQGSLSMNSVDFFGWGCISMGITKLKNEQGYEVFSQGKDRIYKKFVLKGNRIVGMVLLGDIKSAGIVSTLIKNKIDVSSIKHLLLDDTFNYAKIMPLVKKFQDKFKEEEFQDTVITY